MHLPTFVACWIAEQWNDAHHDISQLQQSNFMETLDYFEFLYTVRDSTGYTDSNQDKILEQHAVSP